MVIALYQGDEDYQDPPILTIIELIKNKNNQITYYDTKFLPNIIQLFYCFIIYLILRIFYL